MVFGRVNSLSFSSLKKTLHHPTPPFENPLLMSEDNDQKMVYAFSVTVDIRVTHSARFGKSKYVVVISGEGGSTWEVFQTAMLKICNGMDLGISALSG